jgi:RNA polymerase sigma-70 factor (ECF subfamily)
VSVTSLNSHYDYRIPRHALLAYWILQSREDAEDAVQDACVRAFRAFDTFTGTGARAWLLAIVRNVAYSALDARKRSRIVITLCEELSLAEDQVNAVSQEPSPDAVVIVQERSNFFSTH